MKASVKLRRDQDGRVQKLPIVKAKLPFDFLGFPVYAGFKACGHIQELSLRLSCARQEAGPSVEVSFRPHEQDRPFTLSFKTGVSPWPSSPASALTMAAEFNVSRPSNPSFLLRVKPQLGDFSICHDFRTAVFGSGTGATSTDEDERKHGLDEPSSDMGFTNAFSRYATKLHLSENSSLPWHDAARKEISDAGARHHRFDVTSNANLASFDSTPYASERASFSMFDLVNFRSECPSPRVQISSEEKRFQDMGQQVGTATGWGPMSDKVHSRNLAVMPRLDDGWEHVMDGASQSITSVSSSTLQSRDNDHPRVRRFSQSTSSLAGWASRGFCEGGRLRACTRLPISPEAHLKMRWSLSVSSAPSLLPLLLLDKVSLEASPPAASTCGPSLSPSLPSVPKDDTQPEGVTHLKLAESLSTLRATEKNVLEGGPIYADIEGNMDQVHELRIKKPNMKKSSFLGRLLHGKGLLD